MYYLKKTLDGEPMSNGRNTKQKQLILSILKEADCPLSINDIYNKIVLELPHIAKSTIYRNIDLLLDQNMIEKYHLNDNEVFYKYKTDKNHHTHFMICDNCKKIYYIPVCPIKDLEAAMEAEGFIIKDHQIQITGICKNCAAHHK
jgi:Ferric uptake regulator family.